MANQGVAVLVFSSELEELLTVCSDIVILKSGEIKGMVKSADTSKEQLLALIS